MRTPGSEYPLDNEMSIYSLSAIICKRPLAHSSGKDYKYTMGIHLTSIIHFSGQYIPIFGNFAAF